MSNELVRYGQKSLLKTETTTTEEVGNSLMKVGVAGLAVGGLAFILPVITLPILLVIMVISGILLRLKG